MVHNSIVNMQIKPNHTKRDSTPLQGHIGEKSAESNFEGKSMSFSEIVNDNDPHMNVMNVTNEMRMLEGLSTIDNQSPSRLGMKTERKIHNLQL